ncbi:MAG: hypothetical protein IJP22_01545 [Clostridia bacterium]|nr:hypothetical protein [Clostridia bacterium]
MNEYKVLDGKIVSESGLPWMPRLFCDDRLMFEINNNEITEIKYFNPTAIGNHIVLRKNFYKCITFFARSKKASYEFLPSKTSLTPYGFDSLWNFPEGEIDFSIKAVKNSLVITLVPRKIEEGFRFLLELHQDSFFMPQTTPKPYYNPQLGGAPREWKNPVFEDNLLKTSYTDTRENQSCTTAVYMGATCDLSLKKTPNNDVFSFSTPVLEKDKEYTFVIAFESSEEKASKKIADMLGNFKTYLAEIEKRYAAVVEKAPRLICDNEKLSNFVALTPLINESLKMLDVEGALRANTKHYVAWGCDSIVHSMSLTNWGDNEYGEKILSLAQKLGFPIHCAYTVDSKRNCHAGQVSHLDASYIIALYSYVIGGGELTDYHYDFCKVILDKILATVDEKTGLFVTGTNMCFDYFSEEDGTKAPENCYGAKENGTMYQGIRAMQQLAFMKGDSESLERATKAALKFEENYLDIFYNKEAGYIPAAVESGTNKQINSYSAYLSVFENDFYTDLFEEVFGTTLEYFKENYISTNGLRPLSLDHPGFDADGNQTHCWWPTYNADFYSRMIFMLNETELIEQYLGWISYWSERLSMPEGMDVNSDNFGPKFDNWNMCCGAWQMFVMRAFYQTIIRSYIGADFDASGVTVYPYSGKENKIENLHAFGKIFNIENKGEGRYLSRIILNGKEIKGTNRIPFDMIESVNNIVIEKCDKAPELSVYSFNGAKITDYSIKENKISFNAEITGHAILKVITEKDITISIGGNEKVYKPVSSKVKITAQAVGKTKIEIRL